MVVDCKMLRSRAVLLLLLLNSVLAERGISSPERQLNEPQQITLHSRGHLNLLLDSSEKASRNQCCCKQNACRQGSKGKDFEADEGLGSYCCKSKTECSAGTFGYGYKTPASQLSLHSFDGAWTTAVLDEDCNAKSTSEEFGLPSTERRWSSVIGGTNQPFQKVARGRTDECSHPESVQWLNMLLGGKGLWQHINKLVDKIIVENVQPAIRDALHGVGFVNVERLLDLHFENTSLGSMPPRLDNLKMCTLATGGLSLQARMSFQSDMDFVVKTSLVKFGLHDLSIEGNVHIQFEQFIDEVPLVGGITVYFVDPPSISWRMTGIGSLSKLPWIEDVVKNAVNDAIASLVVVPNQIVVPLARKDQGLEFAALKQIPPLGLLLVKSIEAKQLEMADTSVLGWQTPSDPYVVLQLGAQKWKSTVQKDKVNATWQEDVALLVQDREQSLQVKVKDEDRFTGPDNLGENSVRLEAALSDPKPLSLNEQGTLMLDTTWLCIAEGGPLSRSLPSILRIHVDKVIISAAELEVQVVAKAGPQEVATAYYQDVIRGYKVDEVSLNVIQHLMSNNAGYKSEDIAHMTGLDEDLVDEVMKTMQFNNGRAQHGEIDIEQLLYMPFFPKDLGTVDNQRAVLTLEVKTKKSVLGSLDISLDQVPQAEVTADQKVRYHNVKLKMRGDGHSKEVILHASLDLLATSTRSCFF